MLVAAREGSECGGSLQPVVRLAPEDRRASIVDSALAVARRKGLATTTVRDVATEMGTSSGLVHHYFDSMDEVLAAAFALAASQDLASVGRAVAAADTPMAAMVAFVDSYAPETSDWSFQLWLDAWSEAARRPSLRATSLRLNVAWQRLLADLIERGVDLGTFRSNDPHASAWRIISLFDGLVLQVVAHRTTVDRDRMMEWARRFVEGELGLDLGSLSPS